MSHQQQSQQATRGQPLALSVDQVVALTPFSRSSIDRAIASGSLRAQRPTGGRRWAILPADLVAWLGTDRHPAPTAADQGVAP
jgi:predicted DNA-binding transcriptional regulator AlpA